MSTLKHCDGAKSAQVESLEAQRELACPGQEQCRTSGAGCGVVRSISLRDARMAAEWKGKKQHAS